MNQHIVAETQSLSLHIGHHAILKDVTLQLQEGEIYALIGSNGSGKTTLLKVLAGLACDIEGICRINGQDNPWKAKDAVCYIPASPQFRHSDTISLLLWAFKLLFPKYDSNIAEDSFTRLGFHGRQRIGELSSGQRMLVSLILSLARQAKLYLLDEPFASVDASCQKQLKKLLLECASSGKTLLISTHIIEPNETMFDRVLLMKHGTITKNISADDIRSTTGHSIQEWAAKEVCL